MIAKHHCSKQKLSDLHIKPCTWRMHEWTSSLQLLQTSARSAYSLHVPPHSPTITSHVLVLEVPRAGLAMVVSRISRPLCPSHIWIQRGDGRPTHATARPTAPMVEKSSSNQSSDQSHKASARMRSPQNFTSSGFDVEISCTN